MAKTAGRLCVIKKNSIAIAGFKANSITSNKAPIDVGDKDSGPNAELLDGTLASQTLEISGEGLEDGQVLRDLGLSSDESAPFLN